MDRAVSGYSTTPDTWHVAGQPSLSYGLENHKATVEVVEDGLINQLRGCFYVGPALYAFIFSI